MGLSFLLLSLNCYPQNEANNWYFGGHAALNFNNNTVTVLHNSAMSAGEGCASMSDSVGNLLFYSNGEKVWNRNHQVMPNGNGLNSYWSSTQSCMILKKPGSNHLYYLFTVDAFENNYANGLQYSVIDMNLNGGLGDITSIKNVLLHTPVNEKLTAVKHANGTDYWIIVHGMGGTEANAYLSYQFSSQGISTNPVYSYTGTYIFTGNNIYTAGYLKPSHDGAKLVSCTVGAVDVLDFNNQTGDVTLNFNTNITNGGSYGAEFSPNNRFLYVGGGPYFGIGSISLLQLDLSILNTLTMNQLAVPLDTTFIDSSNQRNIFAIQLANNGKLYTSNSGAQSIGCINSPNIQGISCNYQASAINIFPDTCWWGLPYFVNTNTQIYHYNKCVGDSTEFAISDTALLDSVYWNFGDMASGASNTSKLLKPKHVFSSSGSYAVTALVYKSNTIDTLENNIQIYTPPLPIVLSADTNICDNFILTLQSPNYSTIWSNETIGPSTEVNTAGLYWAKAENVCGFTSDTIVINQDFPIQLNLGNDFNYCDTLSYLLLGSSPNTIWSNNIVSAINYIQNQGTYWAIDSNYCGIVTDTIHITKILPPAAISLGNDTSFCDNFSFTLIANNQQTVWSNNSIAQQITVNNAGVFWATDSNYCGIATDTIVISQKFSPPQFFLGADTSICEWQSIQLNAIDASTNWSNGVVAQDIIINNKGKYWASSTNQCGFKSDTINIDIIKKPVAYQISDTTICQKLGVATFTIPSTIQNFVWSNNEISNTISISDNGKYWLTIKNECGTATDTFSIETVNCEIQIPNAISSDANGVNDSFVINGIDGFSNVQLLIYNRWGNLIYENNNYDNNWNASDVAAGTYYYILKISDNQVFKGFIEVIK